MTKQLKLAIVLMTTIVSMNVNAQKKATVKTTKPKTAQSTTESKTSKPTKQETMDWIAGKMKENISTHSDDVFVSYKDGIFTYRNNYGSRQFCDYSFDLNKVTTMNDEYSKDFYIQGRQLIYVQCDYDKAGQGNFYNNLSMSGPNYNNYRTAFSFTPDQALVDRLKKAFATLIEYNATKKGADEKF